MNDWYKNKELWRGQNESVAKTNLEVIAIFNTTKLHYCMMTVGQLQDLFNCFSVSFVVLISNNKLCSWMNDC